MRSDLDAAVAAELRAELARQQRSKRWMAAALHLPPSTVNRWLNGTTAFSISELDAMCRVLDVTIADLLGRIGSPGPDGGVVRRRRSSAGISHRSSLRRRIGSMVPDRPPVLANAA